MHALVSGKARMAARTLLARARCVDVVVNRPDRKAGRGERSGRGRHGTLLGHAGSRPQTDDSAVVRCLVAAARKLNESDEAGAQKAPEASGLTRLSSDGAVLMRAVAGSLGVGPLRLPWAEGARLWRAEYIEANLALFKDHAPSAGLLAKAELKAPRLWGVTCSQSLWKTTTRLAIHLFASVVSHVTLDNVIRRCYSAQHVGKQRSVGGIA